MKVVVDAGPLIYLHLLEVLEILHSMFGTILVPGAVLHELESLGNPRLASTRGWAASPPDWVESRDPHEIAAGIDQLQAGEAAAISLAWETGADLIILGDAEARRAAVGIRVIGTLGVLDAAAREGLVIDLSRLLDRLIQETPFRCGPRCLEIVAEMKRRDFERRGS